MTNPAEITETDYAPMWNRIRADFDQAIPLTTCTSEFRDALLRFCREFLERFGSVTEYDARVRERAAFWNGGAWYECFLREDSEQARERSNSQATDRPMSSAVDRLARKRDEIYPMFERKQVARSITLSDGRTYKLDELVRGQWMRRCTAEEMSHRKGADAEGWWSPWKSPPCESPEDFEQCAALLREVHGNLKWEPQR